MVTLPSGPTVGWTGATEAAAGGLGLECTVVLHSQQLNPPKHPTPQGK
jgi:hypothetical protein